MKSSLYILLVTASLQSFASTWAQELKFDFSGLHLTSATLDGHEVRDLQTSSEPCNLVGSHLVCNYAYQIQGQTYDPNLDTKVPTVTDVSFQARCDGNANAGFDYRRASNCGCQATLTKTTDSGTSVQYCPCQVCAAELGDNPIHINCTATSSNSTATESAEESGSSTTSAAAPNSTNFIVQTCSSVDCFGYCNSTCSLNCDDTTMEPCDFCTATGTKGEVATNGEGKKEIDGFGESGTQMTVGSTQVVAAITALAVFWL